MPHVQRLGDITKQLGYHNESYLDGNLNFTLKDWLFKSDRCDKDKPIDRLMADVAEQSRDSCSSGFF